MLAGQVTVGILALLAALLVLTIALLRESRADARHWEAEARRYERLWRESIDGHCRPADRCQGGGTCP